MTNKPRRRALFIVLSVLFVVAALGAAIYFARPVALVAPVAADRAVNAVPGSVTVEAEYQIDLKSETAGRVVTSELHDGKSFKKGDFLAQVDTGDLELEIEELRHQYEAHKSRVAVGSALKLDLATARDDLEIKRRQLKAGNASESDVTKQERTVQAAEQRVELEKVENTLKTQNYETQLKAKQRQLEKMTIRAPFDGIISKVYAHPGDLISNAAPIATIITTSRTVKASISEENFAGVRVGQKASVRFLGYGSQLYNATVERVLPVANPETQRYVVYLDVDLPVEKLVPGLTGEVSIIIDTRDSKTVIPRRALRGNQVFVVKGGEVQLRTVELGYVALNKAEILKGVEQGENVIVEDLDQFQPGEHVRAKVVQ
jgi:RND family efflux transporter MFP subunit